MSKQRGLRGTKKDGEMQTKVGEKQKRCGERWVEIQKRAQTTIEVRLKQGAGKASIQFNQKQTAVLFVPVRCLVLLCLGVLISSEPGLLASGCLQMSLNGKKEGETNK